MKIFITAMMALMLNGCTVIATAFVEHKIDDSNSKFQVEIKKEFTYTEWRDLRR